MFYIEPAMNEKIAAYTINLIISDSMGASGTYSFKIEVIRDEAEYAESTAIN